jgi:hypothetical protein
MSNEKKREYVGKGVKAGQFDLINISVCIDNCEPHIFEYNGKRYIKLTVGGLRETDQYGKTHSVWINDYKPNENNSNNSGNNAPKQVVGSASNDLPF